MPISWMALFNTWALPSYTGSMEPLSKVGTSSSSFGSSLLKLALEFTLGATLDWEVESTLLSMFLGEGETEIQKADPERHPKTPDYWLGVGSEEGEGKRSIYTADDMNLVE